MWTNNQQIIMAIGYTVGYLSVLIYSNWWQKHNTFLSQYCRRIIHIITGIYAILLSLQMPAWLFMIVCFAYFIAMIFSKRCNYFNCIHAVKRETYGEALFPLGIILTTLISGDNQSIFIVSMLILTMSDSLAGLAGDLQRAQQKTILGSVIFFTITIMILMIFSISLPYVVIVALALTLVERISTFGLDNLLIPLIGSMLLAL